VEPIRLRRTAAKGLRLNAEHIDFRHAITRRTKLSRKGSRSTHYQCTLLALSYWLRCPAPPQSAGGVLPSVARARSRTASTSRLTQATIDSRWSGERPRRSTLSARLSRWSARSRMPSRTAGTHADCPSDSTTCCDRYPPDGPTPRASTMPCLAARTFPSLQRLLSRHTVIRRTSSRHP